MPCCITGLQRPVCAGAFALLLFALPVSAQDEVWLPSLLTQSPQEGFDLAVSLSRRAVKTTQPDVDTLHLLRPVYASDADSLIRVSQTVAVWFATVSAANDYWKKAE